MNELSKQEVGKTFSGIVEKFEEERPKTPTEVIASLADSFRKGEMPLEELLKHEADTSKAWEEDGFGRAFAYLDEGGDVVIVAPSAENKRDRAFSKVKTEKTWRFLVDGEVMTVTVPPELQGASVNFRSSRGYDSIYRLPETEGPKLTEDMQRLIDKFGPELGRGHDGQEGTLGGMVALYSVASVIEANERKAHRQEQEERQRKYNKDESEAWHIHDTANYASAKVKRGLFMNATTHAALRSQAYREVVSHQLNNNPPEHPGGSSR